jgi:hypothetical protein
MKEPQIYSPKYPVVVIAQTPDGFIILTTK